MKNSLIDIHTHNDKDPLFTSIHSYHEGDLVSIMKEQHMTCHTEDSLYAYLNSYYSVGFHPMFISNIPSQGDYDVFCNIISNPRCLAIGECGFDKRSSLSLSDQHKVVVRQVEISEICGRPIVWHLVGGWNEIHMLRKTIAPKSPWIIHGYRKGPRLAEQLLSSGIYLSFGEYYNVDSLRLAYQSGLMLSETDESVLSIRDILSQHSKDLDVTSDILIRNIRKSLSFIFDLS